MQGVPRSITPRYWLILLYKRFRTSLPVELETGFQSQAIETKSKVLMVMTSLDVLGNEAQGMFLAEESAADRSEKRST